MNYKNIYDDLILRAKALNRVKLEKGSEDCVYYESHHIIPKCLGGSNNKDNLVLLTAREHFVAHKLLLTIYPNNKSLIHSLWMMSNCNNINKYNTRNYKVSSKEYASLKEEYSKIVSERVKGVNNPMYGSSRTGKMNPNFGNVFSEETREKIRKKATGRIVSPETRSKLREYGKKFRTGENSPMFGKKHSEQTKINQSLRQKGKPFPGGNIKGKKHSDETKTKISLALKGRLISQETKDKLSIINKNKKNVSCPHCGKTMDIYNAKRWHFDNCKNKAST